MYSSGNLFILPLIIKAGTTLLGHFTVMISVHLISSP